MLIVVAPNLLFVGQNTPGANSFQVLHSRVGPWPYQHTLD